MHSEFDALLDAAQPHAGELFDLINTGSTNCDSPIGRSQLGLPAPPRRLDLAYRWQSASTQPIDSKFTTKASSTV
jgi:hypothetical protein